MFLGKKKHFVNLPVMLENMTWELSLRIIIKKKSIFEVPKNLNYLFAATGLILDIWGLIGSFFFAQVSLHSRAASFQQVPDMLQISNRNWTSQTEWRSDIIMWQNPCFRSTVLLRRLNLNLGLQRSAVWF